MKIVPAICAPWLIFDKEETAKETLKKLRANPMCDTLRCFKGAFAGTGWRFKRFVSENTVTVSPDLKHNYKALSDLMIIISSAGLFQIKSSRGARSCCVLNNSFTAGIVTD